MPCITFVNEPSGPTLDIGLSVASALKPPGAPKAQIHWIKAIADTGCTNTSIHSGAAAAAVGMQVIGKCLVHSTTHVVPANTYLGDLWFRIPLPNGGFFEWCFQNRVFLELLKCQPEFEALLGMDILGQGVFVVNGTLKTSTFCW